MLNLLRPAAEVTVLFVLKRAESERTERTGASITASMCHPKIDGGSARNVPAAKRKDSMFRLPEGFFKLPPNFRKYAKFISYGWGGFAVVATVVFAVTWVQHRTTAVDSIASAERETGK